MPAGTDVASTGALNKNLTFFKTSIALCNKYITMQTLKENNVKTRFNVKIPDEFHKFLKIQAASTGVTSSKIFEDLVEQLEGNYGLLTNAITELALSGYTYSDLTTSNKGWSVQENCVTILEDISNKLGLSKNYIAGLLIFNYKLEVEASKDAVE